MCAKARLWTQVFCRRDIDACIPAEKCVLMIFFYNLNQSLSATVTLSLCLILDLGSVCLYMLWSKVGSCLWNYPSKWNHIWIVSLKLLYSWDRPWLYRSTLGQSGSKTFAFLVFHWAVGVIESHKSSTPLTPVVIIILPEEWFACASGKLPNSSCTVWFH